MRTPDNDPRGARGMVYCITADYLREKLCVGLGEAAAARLVQSFIEPVFRMVLSLFGATPVDDPAVLRHADAGALVSFGVRWA